MTCDVSMENDSIAIPDLLPWVEKYRPQKLDEIVGNNEVIIRLKHFVKTGSMPHMILAGPPGIGKTTSVICLANEMFGSKYPEALLELNASDERGIDVVRGKIKSFAQRKVTLPANKHKIIILDEADSMTEGAQQALRRVMEIYSITTRFVLACNRSDKIIEPIQSRCAMVRFSKPNDDQIKTRLKEIAAIEKVSYVENGLDAVIFTCQGDLRQAVNNLQSTWTGYGHVDGETVFKVCDEPHPLMVREMIKSCLQRDIDNAYSVLLHLWSAGYSCEDILSTIYRVTSRYAAESSEPPMSELTRIEYLKNIGLVHVRVTHGLSTLLQMSGLLSGFCKNQM
ncbi:hypothetical protein GJ496_009519 [Pomphorhynchus laevis]|nr:hypothetical protein GJ496_009519 [Pomphorhynchus laevis]